MNSDIRLSVSFRGHRKRKRLRLLLGPGSTDYLIDLWIATSMNHPGGLLEGMDETDIALEAGWEDDPARFVAALLECGLLEKNENGVFALHDWNDHQGYVIHSEQRKMQARNAASARWNKRTAETSDTVAQEMPSACCQQCGSNAAPADEQCPLPAPDPSPLPDPDPSPVPEPDPTPQPAPAPAPSAKAALCDEKSEAYRLAVLMRDTLKAHVPTLREPNLQKWARSFDLALRRDERMKEPAFVAEVIVWACSHSFWRTNIQSPDKLREKFDQLTAKMESEAEKARGSRYGWKSDAQLRLEANRQACRDAEQLLFGAGFVEAGHDQG